MYNLPSPRVKKLFRFFASAGADAVIGHHSHCYSGYEIYNNVPIFYGLGNFVFDIPEQHDTIWNIGYAVELSLNKPMSFDIIPYRQCDKDIGLRLLTEKEKDNFNMNISYLNSIISDDEKLSNEFKKYCEQKRHIYTSFLEPHSKTLLHFLRKRGLFPSLLSNRKKILYLNLMRCESHRDILINLLDNRR
jgi:poly-gamma-glutamate synthesis protein (capsule biosynthesis protein)